MRGSRPDELCRLQIRLAVVREFKYINEINPCVDSDSVDQSIGPQAKAPEKETHGGGKKGPVEPIPVGGEMHNSEYERRNDETCLIEEPTSKEKLLTNSAAYRDHEDFPFGEASKYASQVPGTFLKRLPTVERSER